MKYIITLLVALSMSVASYAGVVRHGNTFVVENTTSVNQDTKTQFTWQDKDGNNRTSVEVIAEKAYFDGDKKQVNQQQQPQFEEVDLNGDLPF